MTNKNNFFKLSSSGFTLIELLLVFSIIGILSGVGVYTFGNYNKSQVFQQGYDNFVQTLNVAKSKAMSQVDSCRAGESLNGYSVVIQSSNSYSLNVVCSGTLTLVSDYTLPTGMTFSVNSNSATILFPVVNGAAIINGTTGSITITLQGLTKTKAVTVNSSGLIE